MVCYCDGDGKNLLGVSCIDESSCGDGPRLCTVTVCVSAPWHLVISCDSVVSGDGVVGFRHSLRISSFRIVSITFPPPRFVVDAVCRIRERALDAHT